MTDYCCPNPIRGLRERVTETDLCGVPEAEGTANSRVTVRAFISAQFSFNLLTGPEITQLRADGSLCTADKSPDQLKWLDFSQVLCGYPTPMMIMWLSMNSIVDDDGNVDGAFLPSRSQQSDVEANSALQVEIWQYNKGANACDEDVSNQYLRNVFPLVTNRQLTGQVNIAAGQGSELSLAAIVQEAPGYEPSNAQDVIFGSGSASGTTNAATVRESGPWGYVCDDALPEAFDCGFQSTASGS